MTGYVVVIGAGGFHVGRYVDQNGTTAVVIDATATSQAKAQEIVDALNGA